MRDEKNSIFGVVFAKNAVKKIIEGGKKIFMSYLYVLFKTFNKYYWIMVCRITVDIDFPHWTALSNH